MTLCYKLTDENMQTRNGCQWGEGVEHTAPGKGKLCTNAYIHVYSHPLLAVFFNPIHADFANPILWECDGDIKITDHWLKAGCTRVKTIRQIPLPEITTEQRAEIGLSCALVVYHEPSFVAWANRWLDGSDRSEAAADAAAEAAARAAWAAARAAAEAAWAAWAAARAAAEAAWAAEAAEAAARAAEAAWAAEAAARAAEAARAAQTPLDLVSIIRGVVEREVGK